MKTLVVARWKEDVDWTKDVPDTWQVELVQKDEDLPNEGREVSSFLWAMDRMYHKLFDDDTLAFVQGNPFDHCPNLFEILGGNITGYTPLGRETYGSDATGLPHHNGLPVKEKMHEWLGKQWPGNILFTGGGQFAVTGKDILARPIKFYRDMQVEACEGENAWVFERLWKYVFA